MARIVKPTDAPVLKLPGRQSRELASGKLGAQSTTMRMVRIAPNLPARGPHVHHGFEEIIHVLEGQGLFRTDDDAIPVTSGDTILVPADERHATENVGTGELVLICAFPVSDIVPETREFADWITNND